MATALSQQANLNRAPSDELLIVSKPAFGYRIFAILLRILALLFVAIYFLAGLICLHPDRDQLLAQLHFEEHWTWLSQQHSTQFSNSISTTSRSALPSINLTASLLPIVKTTTSAKPISKPQEQSNPGQMAKKNLVDTTLNLDPINQQSSPISHPADGLAAIDSLPIQEADKVPAAQLIVPGLDQLSNVQQEVVELVELREQQKSIAPTLVIPSVLTDYEAMKLEAAANEKYYMLQFGAKWCLPCKQLNNGPFQDPSVKRLLQKKMLRLEIDIEDFDGHNLKTAFQINQIPALLIFDEAGTLKGQYTGAMSTSTLLQFLNQSLQKGTSGI